MDPLTPVRLTVPPPAASAVATTAVRPVSIETAPAPTVQVAEFDPIPPELAAELVPASADLRSLRAEVGVHRETGQFFARVFDKNSGELVIEYPSEKTLRAIATARAHFRQVFDGTF
jgi:hypothetical protein